MALVTINAPNGWLIYCFTLLTFWKKNPNEPEKVTTLYNYTYFPATSSNPSHCSNGYKLADKDEGYIVSDLSGSSSSCTIALSVKPGQRVNVTFFHFTDWTRSLLDSPSKERWVVFTMVNIIFEGIIIICKKYIFFSNYIF